MFIHLLLPIVISDIKHAKKACTDVTEPVNK
jgi:hypothetical protein